MEGSLSSLLESSLKWIFVGGKGGVGKTTTSCSLAVLMASTPLADSSCDGGLRTRRVLLVSTDPAHNLSDAFDQKVKSEPTPISGMETSLFAMEIDPAHFVHGSFYSVASQSAYKMPGQASQGSEASTSSALQQLGSIFKEAASNMPGIDELSVFVEVFKGVELLSFDVVIFDTAPTGHTLRLLSMPHTLTSTVEKIVNTEGATAMLSAAATMVLSATSNSTEDSSSLSSFIQSWLTLAKEVQSLLTDDTKTAFVCVCIPEFLSVYETERLLQELMKCNIGCEHVVVNQLVLKPASEPPCRMCLARQNVQNKYLRQIDKLYEDFHVVKMPLMSNEVRGLKSLLQFSRFLREPYNVNIHGYVDLEPLC